jgi:hypothetical protein
MTGTEIVKNAWAKKFLVADLAGYNHFALSTCPDFYDNNTKAAAELIEEFLERGGTFEELNIQINHP